MTDAQITQLAQRVLAEGRAFRMGWYCDGDGESGPSGGATPGVRLGRLRLTVSRNGTCYLEIDTKSRGYPRYVTVFDTGLGSRQWGMKDGVYWVDGERKAIRDQVEARAKQ